MALRGASPPPLPPCAHGSPTPSPRGPCVAGKKGSLWGEEDTFVGEQEAEPQPLEPPRGVANTQPPAASTQGASVEWGRLGFARSRPEEGSARPRPAAGRWPRGNPTPRVLPSSAGTFHTGLGTGDLGAS